MDAKLKAAMDATKAPDPTPSAVVDGARKRGSMSSAAAAQTAAQSLNFMDNADFKELFTMFDADGGGTIDEEEFTAMLKILGISTSEFLA